MTLARTTDRLESLKVAERSGLRREGEIDVLGRILVIHAWPI